MSDLVLGPETKKALRQLAVARAERERRAGQRLWAVFMLARSLDVAESILRGRPVMVRNLDREALRRALRSASPPESEFIEITAEHLDAVAECGPLTKGGAAHERRAA